MTSGVVPAFPRIRFNDSNGNPLVGGSVTVYLAGTTTLASVYQDSLLTVSQQNPVPLDSDGGALFWLSPSFSYKFLVLDVNGATVPGWPVDNVPGVGYLDLTAVAGSLTAIGTVASHITNVDTVADNAASVDTVANNITAIQQMFSSGRVFTTTALGITGTTSGQTFSVIQSNGEGVDTCLNSAGTAVWQSAGTIGELALADVVSRTTSGVYAPVAAMLSWQVSGQNGRGSLNSARPKSRVFGRNLNAYVYGPRQQGSAGSSTTTPFFANGPTKTGTATRFLTGAVTDLFSVWTSAYRPPAGTYTVDFQVKSNTGSDIAIRTGNATNGWTARTALTAGWTRVQHQITTDGSNWATFSITGDGTNTPDILIDEMRIYEDVIANVPAIASDVQGDDFMPTLAVRKTRFSGRLLDNTAATAEGSGVLRTQDYPTATTFNEITMICAASLTTAAANEQLLTTDTATALSTTNTTLGITNNQADGSPDFTGITSFFSYNAVGQGVVVYTATVKNGARSLYLDTVELGSATSAFTAFSARMFRVGANSSIEVAYASNNRWQGLIGAPKVFDKYMSAAEIATEVAKVKADLRAAGITLGDLPGVVIAIGDSQTASSSGARGPSWAYLQANAGTFTPNMPVRSLAVGGTTTQDAINSQLPTALLMVAQAIRGGIRPVVAIFTATNDQTAIVTDWNNGVSSFTSPTGWWQTTKTNLIAPLVAAGAKVVFATPLPDGATPPANWDSARIALGTKQKADYSGSTSVFIADFGGTTGISTVADTAGANYDTDHRHLSTAGHVVAAPVATAAITLAMDAP